MWFLLHRIWLFYLTLSLIVKIANRFLRKSQLTMPEALKSQVKQALKDGASIEKTIFDEMEQEVSRS